MVTLFIVILLIILLTGGYGYGWGGWGNRYGYGPGYGLGGLLLIIVIVWLLFGAGAHAATERTQDLNTVQALGWYQILEPYLLTAVQALAAVGVPIFAAILYKLTGIKLETADRTAIQTAAANSAGRIIHAVEGPVSNINFAAPGSKWGSIIAAEVNHVMATLPDELKRRNVTPEAVDKMIRAKLGQAQVGALVVPNSSI